MSFALQTRERSRPALPLTALVDVLFLLLIFFVAAPVLNGSDAPVDASSDTAAPQAEGEPIAPLDTSPPEPE